MDPRSIPERLEILHRALDAVAEERMIALEAARKKVTPQQIVNAEIDSNVVVPSDEEVAAVYEKNKARIPVPRDQALPHTAAADDANKAAPVSATRCCGG